MQQPAAASAWPNIRTTLFLGIILLISPFVRAQITLNPVITDATCEPNSGGFAVIPTGGTAPYTYQFSNGNNTNNGNFRGLAAGVYSLLVRDAAGAFVVTDITIAGPPNSPVLSFASFSAATDCDRADATVRLRVTGGIAPLEYSKDGITYQSSDVFAGLTPGDYTFFVRDATGCLSTVSTAAIGNLRPAGCSGFNIGYNPTSCNNDGRLWMDPHPEVSGYSSDGINFSPSVYLTGLPAGLQRVYIRSTSGQLLTYTVFIRGFCGINLRMDTDNASCTGADGMITVVPTGGSGSYEYSIDGINFTTDARFTGLRAGAYNISVKDGAGNTAWGVAQIGAQCPVLDAQVTPESCTGNDGVITVTGANGTAPYQYSLDGAPFQPSQTFSNLTAGFYFVTVRDAMGNTGATRVVVTNNCLTITTSTQPAVCGNPSGSIRVNVTPANPNYTYSINGTNFQPLPIFSGLTAGDYIITIRDNAGRTGRAPATVNAENGVGTLLASSNASDCVIDNGTVVVSASGGRRPYAFSIDGINYQDATVFRDLAPGTYTVTVRDAFGCIKTTTVDVETSCLDLALVAQPERCTPGSGSIQATGLSGQVPYQFSLDGAAFQPSGQFTGVTAGLHRVAVRDATAGVTRTRQITVVSACARFVSTVQQPICTVNNGSISLLPSGSVRPYVFAINAGNFQADSVFSGLAPGSYRLQMRDAFGFLVDTTITLTDQPGPVWQTPLVSPETCLGADGSLELANATGTAPLQYQVNAAPPQSVSLVSNLSAGTYQIQLIDANGCRANGSVEVPVINDLITALDDSVAICEGLSAQLSLNSNASSVTWSPATGLNSTTIPDPIAAPTSTTTYTVEAVRGNCTATESILVRVNPRPVADAGENFALCYGQNAQLQASGGLYYQWSPGTFLSNSAVANPRIVRPTSNVRYAVMVTDANGCRALDSAVVNMTVEPQIRVDAGRDTTIVMNRPYQLQATMLTNNPVTGYSWTPSTGLSDPTSPSPVATISEDTRYTVSVATVNGCEGTASVMIKVLMGPNVYVPTAFSPNGDGINDLLQVTSIGLESFGRFSVFNRGGQLVFSTTEPGRGWDGTVGGVKQANQVFVWICEAVADNGTKIVQKGTVTLLR